jgi:hypothetical protein
VRSFLLRRLFESAVQVGAHVGVDLAVGGAGAGVGGVAVGLVEGGLLGGGVPAMAALGLRWLQGGK